MLAMTHMPDFQSGHRGRCAQKIQKRCNCREQFVLGVGTIKETNQMAKLIFQIVLIEPSGLNRLRPAIDGVN
jgi:hypothetical protein